MSDIRASYVRLLSGASDAYTDAQLVALATMPPPTSALPADFQLCGVLAFHRFPVPEPNPIEPIATTWSAVDSDAWAAMDEAHWAGVEA